MKSIGTKKLHFESFSGSSINQGILWTQRSKRNQQLLKNISIENDEFTQGGDEPSSQTTLLELFNSTQNPLKVQKLIGQFLNENIETEHKIHLINEVLGNQHATQLFFKMDQIAREIINNVDYMQLFPSLNDLIQLQHMIFEVLSQNKAQNQSLGLSLDIFKLCLLSVCEQYSGHYGRIDEVLKIQNELNNLSISFIINESTYKILSDEFSVDPDQIEIYNIVTQCTMRSSLTITILSLQISNYGHQRFLTTMRSSVLEVQQLEGQIFLFIRQGQCPNIQQLKNLIIAYVLISEQINAANIHAVQKECIEILGKKPDTQISDLYKGFLKNALRFTQKYLNQEDYEQFYGSITNIYKKAQIGLFSSSREPQILNSSSEIQSFLCANLQLNYLISPNTKHMHRVYDIIEILSNQPTPEFVQTQHFFNLQRKQSDSSRSNSKYKIVKQQNNNWITQQKTNDESQDQANINRSLSSSVQNSSRLPVALVNSHQLVNQQKLKKLAQSTSFNQPHIMGFQSPTNGNRSTASNNKVNHDLGSQSESQDLRSKKSNEDYEYLIKELKTQKQDLQTMKISYQKDISQKQIEIQINTGQVEKMQSKIEILESTISQLRTEGGKNKREKDVKESEIVELRVFIVDLQEKQKKLEKQVNLQSEKPPQPPQPQQAPQGQLKDSLSNPTNTEIQQKSSKSIIQSKTQSSIMNIEIPLRGRQQSVKSSDMENQLQQRDNSYRQLPSQISQSPADESMLMQVDEQSPNMKKTLTFNTVSLLEGNLFENNVAFARSYIIYSSNVNKSQTDSNGWDTQYSEVSDFKIDAQFIDTKEEGRQIQLRAYLSNQQVASELFNVEMLKNVLPLIEVNDVIPTNMPLSSIQNTHMFMKYIVLPFAVMQQDDSASPRYKVQIWPKAPGFFAQVNLKIEFLDVTFRVFFHHIESDQFRAVMCDPFSMENVRLDIELDYSSMDYFFQNVRAVKDEYILFEKQQLIQMTEKLEVEQVKDNFNVPFGLEERSFIKTNSNESNNKTQGKVFFQEQLIVTKQKELLLFIRRSIQSLDQALKLQGIQTFAQLSNSGTRYFKYKTWNNATKGQVQLVKDNINLGGLEVYLRNSHETFGPEKTKLKVSGSSIYRYSTIQKDFALTYEKLSIDEKQALICIFLHSFNLTSFDKATEQTEQQFDKNPIVQYQFEIGQYKRTIIRDSSGLTTLTVSVIGIQKRMLGIRFAMFDVDECCEYGVFLPATQSDWDMRAIDKQGKFKASVENIPYSEYLLMQIFKDPLLSQIIFKKVLNCRLKTNVVVNQGDLKKRRNFIEKIDNFINYHEIVTKN